MNSFADFTGNAAADGTTATNYKPEMQKTDRLYYADWLRLVATFCVICIHLCVPLFYEFMNLPLAAWQAVNFWDSVSRWSVPVFFMISGALILDPERSFSYKTLLTKRLPKLLVPLFLWSVIYLLWINRLNIQNGTPLPYLEALKWLFQAPVFYHLWFLYAITGLYFCIPVLRKIVIGSDEALLLYLLAGWFILNGLIQFISEFFQLTFGLNIPVFNLYIGYFLLGYVLNKRPFSGGTLRKIYVTAALSFGLIFWGTWQLVKNGLPNETLYAYHAPVVMLFSSGIFLAFKNINWLKIVSPQSKPGKLVVAGSNLSFGVYLSHALVLDLLKEGTLGFSLSAKSFHPAVAVPVIGLLVLVFCLLLTRIIKAIPGLRWLVP